VTQQRAQAVRVALDAAVRDFQQPTPVDLTLEVAASFHGDLVWVHRPDGSRVGFWIDHPAADEELLVVVADFLQEQIFDQLPQTWGEARPPCPGHQHPAYPRLLDGQAWWICPRNGERLIRIGARR
jgi:hypothetical protein